MNRSFHPTQFRVRGGEQARRRGAWAMAPILIPIGGGLAFALPALFADDGTEA